MTSEELQGLHAGGYILVLLHSGFFVIKARYLKLKKGIWHYQRRNAAARERRARAA